MLLSSSNRKYRPYPLLSYFPVVVCLRCLLHNILSLAYTFCFHYYYAVSNECKESDTFWLADRVRSFVHYTISLSSLCKLIWRHWTYEMSVRYILSSVWVRLSIFSQLSIVQYMGLCVSSLPNFLEMIEKIYTLSFYHPHQVGSKSYYPLSRVRSWNNGMHCVSLYILIEIKTFSLTNLYLNVSSAKVAAILSRPQCVYVIGKTHITANCQSLCSSIISIRLNTHLDHFQKGVNYCSICNTN